MDLQQLRDGIDVIDGEILGLFMKRMELCRDVAEYKRRHSMPVFQGGREQQVIDRIRALTGDPELEAGTAALFTSIMDISKILQNRKLLSESPDYHFTVPDFTGAERIGCQGTSGANSETATRKFFGDKQPRFYKTFEDVFIAVQSGELDYGVLPVHNSTAGSVNSTYDLMVKYSVYTVGEVCVDINHCLAAKADVPESELTTVYSHPQAIAQCCDYLTARGLKTAEYGNTATAAAMVAESDPAEKIAAICSVDCAEKLGLHIIARDITDCALNRTRFVCITRELQVSPDIGNAEDTAHRGKPLPTADEVLRERDESAPNREQTHQGRQLRRRILPRFQRKDRRPERQGADERPRGKPRIFPLPRYIQERMIPQCRDAHCASANQYTHAET